MNYKILEAKITFTDTGKLKEIVTTWDDNGSKRKSKFGNRPMYGYGYLTDNDELSNELLQRACALGENS
jgi:hypothetical protein